jgi:serine/threonine protein kinase
MLEKDPLKRITVADIEDHPWLNSNSAVITLPEEGWSLKTTGSC